MKASGANLGREGLGRASLGRWARSAGVPLLCGLGYGAAMVGASAPLSWWGLSLVAILPLAWCACRPGARPVRDGLLAAVGATPYWFITQAWVREISEFGYYPMAALLSLLVGLFVVLLSWEKRVLPRVPCVVAGPLLWTGLEYVRGEIIVGGYAWGFVVHPLVDAPLVPEIASVGGVYLVSLLVAAMAGFVVDLIHVRADARKRFVREVAFVGGPLGVCTAGLAAIFAYAPQADRSVRVAAVQTNVRQSIKMDWTIGEEARDMARFAALTREAAAHGAELIAWPETMMPGITLEPEALREMRRAGLAFRDEETGTDVEAWGFAYAALELSREVGVPLLIGEEARVGFRVGEGATGRVEMTQAKRFNSVYLLEGGEISATRYDKIHLTPFGEVMPVVHRWPGLQQAVLDFGARGMRFDLDAGRERTVFTVPVRDGNVRVVTPICFEVSDARLCLQMVSLEGSSRDADLIVNVTNDGWFGASKAARAQHLDLARWRCAELRTPMLRAANTGVSALIDARGQIVRPAVDTRASPFDSEGIVVGTLEVGPGDSLYAIVGNLTGLATFGGAAALMVVVVVRARRAKRTAKAVAR
ncbi:MAG: apolipoprotein N-acyltransferase [Planctomycetota bacterium]|nr:apolipoprotein N-acyltransferase [Planctomycetota bacterium]